MRQFLFQLGKRSLIAGGTAGALTFLGMLLMRVALRAMGWEPASMTVAAEIALILGTIGFVMCAVFELLNAGWRRITGREPKTPPPIAPDPPVVGDKS